MRCLAQGNLEAIVGGPVKGRLYEDGFHRVETGQGHCPPVSMLRQLFVGMLLVMYCRRPFWLCCTVEAEALIGPQVSTPAPDILVSMSPSNPHHAARYPKREHGHVPAQTPAVPAGLSNSA